MKKIIFAMFFSIFLLLPTQVFAIDFTINETTIDAYLQEDGTVNVVEKFTYQFEDEFNGITRELVPKEGTHITDFTAFENENKLRVEQEGSLYKIYRSGEYETITVQINYIIHNAIEKFDDGAQFYWPFFDNRNESDYDNITITIHPPRETNEVLSLGYDRAYLTDTVTEDGRVIYKLGFVPFGENADIRVVYDESLFPSLSEQSGTITDKIIAEQTRLAEEIENFNQNQEMFKVIGNILLIGTFSLLMLYFVIQFVKTKQKKNSIQAHFSRFGFSVPEEILSIPSTLYFIQQGLNQAETMAASLLDLIRKGYVKQESDEHFILINNQASLIHEKILIELLFFRIGNGKEFKMSDLLKYTKNKNNAELYRQDLVRWQSALRQEINEQKLHKNMTLFKTTMIILSLLFIIFMIFFVKYDLIFHMIGSIFIIFIPISLAFIYRPKNDLGLKIMTEWKLVQTQIDELTTEQMTSLSNDNLYRLSVYGTGIKDGKFKNKFTAFIENIKQTTVFQGNDSFSFAAYSPVFIVGALNQADTNVQSHYQSSSSSFSSSSGGGVGGGGGGSGAF